MRLFEEELRTNDDRGREVQGGVDKAQCGREEKEGAALAAKAEGGA